MTSNCFFDEMVVIQIKIEQLTKTDAKEDVVFNGQRDESKI